MVQSTGGHTQDRTLLTSISLRMVFGSIWLASFLSHAVPTMSEVLTTAVAWEMGCVDCCY